MIGAALCFLAFAFARSMSSRSRGDAFIAALVVGYFCGIVRARVHDGASHFIFDSATLGIYSVHLANLSRTSVDRDRLRELMPWFVALMGWPVLIALVPYNHFFIQIIGLRAAIFFLPFLLLGARVDEKDLDRIALAVAALNIAALMFGVAEFFLGIERFFPMNEDTQILYASRDIAGPSVRAHRIPATFLSAHAFGGSLVATLPFLANQLLNRRLSSGVTWFMRVAVVATAVGAFLSGARQPVVILFLLLGILALTPSFDMRLRLALASLGLIVAFVVSQSERFQRFATLRDTDQVVERLGVSANLGFFDMLLEHPLGVGLGSAVGTSIPYFLTSYAPTQIGMENEYGRIALELSPVGLLIWVGFILAVLRRRPLPVSPDWVVGTRLIRAYIVCAWGTAFIGCGMLTAIPATAITLFEMGLLMRAPLRQRKPRVLAMRAGTAES